MLDLIDHLRVERLVRAYNWWPCSYYAEPGAKRRLRGAKPISKYLDEYDRPDDPEWDFGRVKHFALLLEHGKKVDPIMVDNYCDRGFVYPDPVLIDGHHRLAAFYLTGQRVIPAFYSGRVDLLDYLKGTRAKRPVY